MRTLLWFEFCHKASVLLVAGSLWLSMAHSASAAADRTRPTTPTNLRLTAITPNSVSLAWNPSTDNSGSFTYIVRELSEERLRRRINAVTN